MLTLIQFPWSPFCITIKHILTRHRIPFRLHNIAYHDRAPIITATKGQGHTVPCLIDGTRGICDVTDFGQEVAHYVDRRYRLHLFSKAIDRFQLILSRYIENDLVMVGFKVNDMYVIPTRPLIERTMLIRHKELKFGRACVREWTTHRLYLCSQFSEPLRPIDDMLAALKHLRLWHQATSTKK